MPSSRAEDERGSGVENVEAISELNVFRAMLLVGVERGTDLLHPLDAMWLCTSDSAFCADRKTGRSLGKRYMGARAPPC